MLVGLQIKNKDSLEILRDTFKVPRQSYFETLPTYDIDFTKE